LKNHFLNESPRVQYNQLRPGLQSWETLSAGNQNWVAAWPILKLLARQEINCPFGLFHFVTFHTSINHLWRNSIKTEYFFSILRFNSAIIFIFSNLANFPLNLATLRPKDFFSSMVPHLQLPQFWCFMTWWDRKESTHTLPFPKPKHIFLQL